MFTQDGNSVGSSFSHVCAAAAVNTILNSKQKHVAFRSVSHISIPSLVVSSPNDPSAASLLSRVVNRFSSYCPLEKENFKKMSETQDVLSNSRQLF